MSEHERGIDRRSALGLTALALAALPAQARAAGAATATYETIPLWPGTPPGGEGLVLKTNVVQTSTDPRAPDRDLYSIAVPELTVIHPAKPDGSAILIAPGGGYSFEAYDREGIEPALRFAAMGATAFILTYRLPYDGWKNRAVVPLQDAQRAMRLIRAMGPTRYNIMPNRVGVIGFSAGGHLAAMLATKYATDTYAPVDDADKMDARPSFAALLYPVITMRPPYAHEASAEKLLGEDASKQLRDANSPEMFIAISMPPCFICAAGDDPYVAPENSLIMYSGLRAQNVLAELHMFEKGGHGFGVRPQPGLAVSDWPELFRQWGQGHGIFTATGAS